eukprot:jgi/Ulvmu1/5775/UM025_0029.1
MVHGVDVLVGLFFFFDWFLCAMGGPDLEFDLRTPGIVADDQHGGLSSAATGIWCWWLIAQALEQVWHIAIGNRGDCQCIALPLLGKCTLCKQCLEKIMRRSAEVPDAARHGSHGSHVLANGTCSLSCPALMLYFFFESVVSMI